ncbi:site-specific integrase [Mycobacterium avium subsp. hominissuis]
MAKIPDYVKVIDLDSGRRYEVRPEVTGPDGKRKQQRKRFKTLKEATDFYTRIASDRSRGVHVAPSELTVEAAVDAWLAAQRVRTKTMTGYITALRPLVDHLGGKAVQAVTKADIEKVVAALRGGTSQMGTWNAPEKIKGKQVRAAWGPSGTNHFIRRTRAVFDDLVQQGVLGRNPAALVQPVPMARAELNTLTAAQAERLLAATRNDVFAVAWRLALMGLRRGEILGLSWDSVDLDAGLLTVRANRAPVPGGVEVGSPKTAAGLRTLPMPAELTVAMKQARKQQRERRLALGSKWVESGLVVVGEDGAPPHPDTLSHVWAETIAAHKLPAVRLHDARHTCATLMHQDGVPLAVISAWLGHTNAAFTLATYGHSSDDSLAAAAQRLDALTGGKATPAEAK